jgi:hypothetical protein
MRASGGIAVSARVGVDAESSLGHTVVGTVAACNRLSALG